MTLSQLKQALSQIATGSGVTKAATLLFAAIGGAGAVTSVFGRTGVVTAQSGDYTAAQVSAAPNTRVLTIGPDAFNLTADRTFLASVTNDAQTKAAIVPNTAPLAGQVLVGNAGSTAYAKQTITGSGATISCSSAGVITISGIANASLANSALTIAGTSTALGGTITLDTILGLAATGSVKRTAANTLGVVNPDANQASAANPTGTISTIGVMMGLGVLGGSATKGGTTTSANSSGKVLLCITGDASSSAVQGGGLNLRFGTGTAPINGAALTGTITGQQNTYMVAAVGDRLPFCLVSIITGLAANTSYWFDLSLVSSSAAATATLFNIGITNTELI